MNYAAQLLGLQFLGALLRKEALDPYMRLTRRLLELIDEITLQRWTRAHTALKGDLPGHPFHGNQYTGGMSGGDSDASSLGVKPETVSTDKGIKEAVRSLFESGHSFTYDELKRATGNPLDVTLKTAIARLQNPKYAGDKGPLTIVKDANGYRVTTNAEPKPSEPKPAEPKPAEPSAPQPDPVMPAWIASDPTRVAVWRGAMDAAGRLGFDKTKIGFLSGKSEFLVNGQKLTSAAHAFPQDRVFRGKDAGRVEVFVENMTPSFVQQAMAHEIEHIRFGRVVAELEEEMSKVRNPSAAEKGYIKDGKLTPSGEKKFPVVKDVGRLISENTEQLERDDGVTPYSRLYWLEYGKDDSWNARRAAFHETLAEIAKIDERDRREQALGFSKPRISGEVSPLWRQLYDNVNKHAERLDEKYAQGKVGRGGPHQF